MMLVISLFHTQYITYYFYYHFYVDKESNTPYSLTSGTHPPASFLSFSSGSIIIPTPNVTQGN